MVLNYAAARAKCLILCPVEEMRSEFVLDVVIRLAQKHIGVRLWVWPWKRHRSPVCWLGPNLRVWRLGRDCGRVIPTSGMMYTMNRPMKVASQDLTHEDRLAMVLVRPTLGPR